MRLTLRTMLAFMDDILDPEDAQVIGKKIEESEFATGLLHRTRDCMRRLRLGAPKVAEHGTGLDPNTVAEYLDNTLPGDRVPDFEKVCLESDVHLAEVASCHQVLAMVLGEPAEVDPASRLRMYGLPELAAGRIPDSDSTPDAEQRDPTTPEPPPAREEKPHHQPRKSEVPEYLRAAARSRRRFWAAAILVLSATVVGIGAMAADGKFGSNTFLSNLFSSDAAEESPDKAPAAPEPPAATDALPADGPIDIDIPSIENLLPEDPAPTGPPADTPAQGPPVDTTPADTPPAAPEPVNHPISIPVDSTDSMGPQPDLPAVPPATPGPADNAAVPDAPEASTDAPPPDGSATPPADMPPEPDVKPAALPRQEVGKYVASTGVLLRFDADSGAWQQVPDGSTMMSDDPFLALPTYQPVITLAEKVKLRLIGSTRVRLLGIDVQGNPGLAVDYGRLEIRAGGNPPVQLRLELGDWFGSVVLSDVESIVAIEIGRSQGSTLDPSTNPALVMANLYAVSGSAVWQDEAATEPTALIAPGRIDLSIRPLEAAPATIPVWLGGSSLSSLDQRASAAVAEELRDARSATLILRELAEDRRTEVRRLALGCLGAIGDFEPLIKALNDPAQRMIWPDCLYVEQLRAAVRRNPLAAVQIRTAMIKRHGGAGNELYEMLWKYDPKTIRKEDFDQLARYLDNDTLAIRRLGFWNLKRITGMGLNYQPEDTEAQRRVSVQRWRERLKDIPLNAGSQSAPVADQPKPPTAPSDVLPGGELD